MNDNLLHIPVSEPIAEAISKMAVDLDPDPKNPILQIKSYIRQNAEKHELVCTKEQVMDVIASLLSFLIVSGELLEALVEQEHRMAQYIQELNTLKQIVPSAYSKGIKLS